jgi:hypothetical protein
MIDAMVANVLPILAYYAPILAQPLLKSQVFTQILVLIMQKKSL